MIRLLRTPSVLALATTVVTVSAAAIGVSSTPLMASAGSAKASVWLQTMDSCKQALGGAAYQLVGPGLDMRVSTPSQTKQRVSSSGTCPVQQGNCASITTGCVQLADLPPGSYRIHETTTPVGDASNPEGYAACNGGSACQSQEVDLTVSTSGTASATVSNVYPNGKVAVYPTASGHSGSSTYAGTAADPIVVHNFGLAPPGFDGAAQCDGDGDPDDHSTGTPSSECQYPEAKEATACKPYPWSCTLAPWATPPVTTTSSSTTSSDSGSTSTTSTTTTSTTSSTSCTSQTFTGTVKKNSSTSEKITTTTAAGLMATLTWSPSATVSASVLDSGANVVRTTSSTGTSLTLAVPNVAVGSYTIKLKVSGATSLISFSLTVSHC
jgi:hypothetical protein